MKQYQQNDTSKSDCNPAAFVQSFLYSLVTFRAETRKNWATKCLNFLTVPTVFLNNGEEIIENQSLMMKMRNDFGLVFQEQGEGVFTEEDFTQVEAAIRNKSRWKINDFEQQESTLKKVD